MRFVLSLLLFLAVSPAFASVSVSVNGTSYTIPQTNEKGWGTNVTQWIQAMSLYTLQPSGGTFTLTAEVDSGATYGFKVPYIKTQTTTPATAGVLRLAKTDVIDWRNNANGANLALGIDTSDNLTFGGVIIPTATSSSVQDSTFTIYDNVDSSKKIAFQASGISTSTTRTLTVPDASFTVVGADTSQTLTNKTLSGNTATNLVSGSGTLTLNTTGTITVPNATDTLVGKATTDTLTNKTLSGNTAVTLISGSGILTLNTSGTVTVPNGTDTLVAKTSTDTLTNKTLTSPAISGPTLSGTITTPLTASRALVTGASNELAVSATTATQIGYLSTTTSDVQSQITAITAAASNPDEIQNCSIAASVAASALTVALKDAAGSDASVGSPCKISFRNATAATGTYTEVSTTAAVSVVVSNGSALGCIASTACTVYVYAINNAGTVVLGVVSGTSFDEGTVQSSTAEGGAGGADTLGTMYSTASQASKAVRLLARLTITPGASFAWSAGPTEISNKPFRPQAISNTTAWTPTGTWSTNTTYVGYWRRVGDMAEYDVTVTVSGAPDSASLSINLPAGHVIDTTKMSSTNADNILGQAKALDSGVAGYPGEVRYGTTTTVFPRYFSNPSGTAINGNDITQAAPFTFGNTDVVFIKFKVPIVGWGI